jgi:hypothetical protein
VNELLGARGGVGLNGGRRWRPFALSAAEYGELVNELVAFRGFVIVDVPLWVASSEDWHVWLMERRRGVPAGHQRRLSHRARDLAKQFEDARADPDTSADQLAKMYLAAKRADEDAAHFQDPWIAVARLSKHRRAWRWFRDAHFRQKAAELAGDVVAAAAAAAEAERVRERLRPTLPDDQWPSRWEDWPEYPLPEQRRLNGPG